VFVLYYIANSIFKTVATTWIETQRSSFQLSLKCLVIFVQFLLFLLGCYLALKVCGVDVTGLIASVGILGAAAGLAFQIPLGNLASGIILDFMNVFQEGDRVEVTRVGDRIGPGYITERNPQFIVCQLDRDGTLLRIPHLCLLTDPSQALSVKLLKPERN
jgi:small-conductance mechanosensitive channel